MLRQLLTLLAVITGLGLSAQPAAATEAQVVSVTAAGDERPCVIVIQRPSTPMRFGDPEGPASRKCDRPVIVVAPAPVQLKADRARE